jgi:SAM-dependent methyltransferase
MSDSAPATARSVTLLGLEINSEDTVVDLGAGMGDACVFAGQVGADIIAVDYDRSLSDHIQGRMTDVPARSFRIVTCDFNAPPIPLEDGTASVVMAKEVMEHLRNPAGFLSELVRIGKPGAKYLITVPDPVSEDLLKLVATPDHWQEPHHINVFQHDELDGLVTDAGLEIVERSYCGFYGSFWWLLRMAIGSHYVPNHFTSGTPPQALQEWDSVWHALVSSEKGHEIGKMLDQLIPKSQVIVARKPERPASTRADKGGVFRRFGLGRSRQTA